MVARHIVSASAAYGLLLCLAVGWAVVDERLLHVHPSPWLDLAGVSGWIASAVLGVALAMAVVWSTRWLVRHAAWAQQLRDALRGALGPLRARDMLLLSLASGIAEELFFRGAMQPVVGLLLTSVLFGALHVGPRRAFLPWTLWATAMGLAFGALYQATGQLIGPVLAHIIINYENLHLLEAHDPRPKATRTHSDPSLVAVRLRSGGRVGNQAR